MRDTPSNASDHLCLISKESIQNCRSYRADWECRTDGRRDEVKPIYPPTTLLCRGIIKIPIITDKVFSSSVKQGT